MNPKISSFLAIMIIFALVVFFGMTFWIMEKKIPTGSHGLIAQTSPESIAPEKKNNCQPKAYKGETKVHLFTDEAKKIRVTDNDLGLLPNFSDSEDFKFQNSIISIIDITKDLQNKLIVASEKKPIVVKITGYAITCKGFGIAALNYKQGIFKEYFN